MFTGIIRPLHFACVDVRGRASRYLHARVWTDVGGQQPMYLRRDSAIEEQASARPLDIRQRACGIKIFTKHRCQNVVSHRSLDNPKLPHMKHNVK